MSLPPEVRTDSEEHASNRRGTDGPPEVLIVGGGIAGLALAGFLHDRGWSPTVVEQTAEWDRVGWGIGLWANGIAVLERLGVAETALARGSTPGAFEIRDADSRELAAVQLPDGNPFLAIHRADLHAALREAVPSASIRMGTVPTRVTQDDEGVTVTYEDGSQDRVDVVVGADGIGSTVRAECFDAWAVDDAGTAVWSFWADPREDDAGDAAASADPAALPEETVSYWARGTEAFVIDIDGRGLVNIATKLPVEETPDPPARDTLESVAADLDDPFPELVGGIPAKTPVFFDRNRRVTADRWHRNRVALIGDAAHAVHPISGMGAALALEDALVLADELTREARPEEALAAFERRRRDRVADVRRTAEIELATAFAESPLATSLRNALVRWTPTVEWFLDRQLDDLTDEPLASV